MQWFMLYSALDANLTITGAILGRTESLFFVTGKIILFLDMLDFIKNQWRFLCNTTRLVRLNVERNHTGQSSVKLDTL